MAKLTKLTKARRELLELALRSPGGNPWVQIGIRQRAGKAVMFAVMKSDGFFDGMNCITEAGRAALSRARGE